MLRLPWFLVLAAAVWAPAGRDIVVEPAAGGGDRLTIGMKRYAHQPTAALPW